MPLFPCEWCDLEFDSKIGHGVHARSTNPAQYESVPGLACRRSRWTNEELRIMAREEVFIPEETRFVNQALVAMLHSKGLFSSGPGFMDEDVECYDEDPHSIGRGISTEEMQRSRLKGQFSPGLYGITIGEWAQVHELKKYVFGIFLLAETVRKWMFAARTVLIPKVSQPTVAADFRPISIASDGLAENIALLAEVLNVSTSKGKLLYVAVIDVRKAFDTVSRAPLMEVLRTGGVLYYILHHILQLYLVGNTTIQLPGKICRGVPVKQGVRQEDTLSPMLFNIFLDEALRDQEASIRFGVWSEVVSRLAFTDDVVVLAGSRAGLQVNLNRLSRALEHFGLGLSAAKLFSLVMAVVLRERHVKVLVEPMFRIGTAFLTPLSVNSTFRYLGIQFARGGVKAFKQDLEGPLEWIAAAPLKLFERMELLKVYLLLSLIYRL
ncbi:hypothetical protein PR048_013204 [Dryococelus australis]|uniref:Reverse transcriptase domain-containing protein n=1 Tax=Dryococelus australis TaxID=614101 RepID=A0ABQ9HS90_9NEOP|nr:hypothetical protein PR048_013204 [Dryococelus australis]